MIHPNIHFTIYYHENDKKVLNLKQGSPLKISSFLAQDNSNVQINSIYILK